MQKTTIYRKPMCENLFEEELKRNLCAFSAGSKALRAGQYDWDAKAIVLCVAYRSDRRDDS